MDMRTPKVAPKELRGWPCRIELYIIDLALGKGIFGYMVPIIHFLFCTHTWVVWVLVYR